MDRTEIINRLSKTYELERYLEIGTQNRRNNFDKIICKSKICVDPDPAAQADCVMTSDEYFKNTAWIFDIILIDGFHEKDQAKRDIINSLNVLKSNGWIVVHDCLPINESMQKVPRETKQWTGDVWKAIVELRREIKLKVVTIDCDWGCAVIQKDKSDLGVFGGELTYENFVKNRNVWMNVVSPEWFERMYL